MPQAGLRSCGTGAHALQPSVPRSPREREERDRPSHPQPPTASAARPTGCGDGALGPPQQCPAERTGPGDSGRVPGTVAGTFQRGSSEAPGAPGSRPRTRAPWRGRRGQRGWREAVGTHLNMAMSRLSSRMLVKSRYRQNRRIVSHSGKTGWCRAASRSGHLGLYGSVPLGLQWSGLNSTPSRGGRGGQRGPRSHKAWTPARRLSAQPQRKPERGARPHPRLLCGQEVRLPRCFLGPRHQAGPAPGWGPAPGRAGARHQDAGLYLVPTRRAPCGGAEFKARKWTTTTKTRGREKEGAMAATCRPEKRRGRGKHALTQRAHGDVARETL